jgi:multisubunit Na+/H+ antiporter MnhB subunit
MANIGQMMWGGVGLAVAVVTVLTVSNVGVSWISSGRWTVSKAADDLIGRLGI